jgi:hypothetical protein
MSDDLSELEGFLGLQGSPDLDDLPELGIPSMRTMPLRMTARKPKARQRGHYDGEVLGGRPYLEAHIPMMPFPGDTWEEFHELRDKYQNIIQKLTYKEAKAWCRAFGCSYSTFLARKYLTRKAKLEEVILTVWWSKHGKPMKFRTHQYRIPFWEAVQMLRSQSNGGKSNV